PALDLGAVEDGGRRAVVREARGFHLARIRVRRTHWPELIESQDAVQNQETHGAFSTTGVGGGMGTDAAGDVRAASARWISLRVIGPRKNDIVQRGWSSTLPCPVCASRRTNQRGDKRCSVCAS